ncbi:MAG: tRNA (guanosine(46)-N7)-methyltransferase TrmB [Chlamydiae bacterium CG10_big_fil_rev_8_21_14_0_10_35_9]|nr:MAG: tRNA (guanosine(46)-N7)-methyltransferase TrmB [Chlamydiae bacterium CG10_big_fil_rev_8_21_14_0_10_35_9]
MKAKDLWIPFSYENRRPVIIQRLLFIPSHYEEHLKFAMPNLSTIFQNENACHVEFCSGNGQWIIDKAKNEPDKNWIAVEKRFDRARKIWVKMHNENLSNLFVVLGSAQDFAKYYLRDNLVDGVFVNFPDPWPKKKHAKNRLFQSEFIRDLAAILKPQRTAFIVTDDETYKGQVIDHFLENIHFRPEFPKPYFINNFEAYGQSFFNDLWVNKGRNIYYMSFIRE